MKRVVVMVIAFACLLAKVSGSRHGTDTDPPTVFVGSSSVTMSVRPAFRPAVPRVGSASERADSVPRPRLASTHGCVGYDRWGNPR